MREVGQAVLQSGDGGRGREGEMIKCDTCPRCKDVYPGKVDADGYHFHICGMSGNKVYTIPHKIKRMAGRGHIHCGVSSCGLYDTVEAALAHMTKAEVRRWRESQRQI